jgi:hypothetical protein
MAIDAPRIAVFLHERRSGVERITTLCTEEVSSMPLGSTCDNDLALDGCFATLASGWKELMEVKVAEEALSFVRAVIMLKTSHVFRSRMRR